MIIGHGIDLQEIDAIKRAYEKNNRFAKRVLTEKEFQVFSGFKAEKRQMEFLAGRWAAKEAFAKAMGTGIVTILRRLKLIFQKGKKLLRLLKLMLMDMVLKRLRKLCIT